MRIIAGTARSLPLKTVAGMDTRPTTDRIKETLFNMLQEEIPGSYFLDLFAGSGQIGLEALSRGASYAVFIENNRKAAKCIEDNISFTKFDKESQLLVSDVFSGLYTLEGKYTFDQFQEKVTILLRDVHDDIGIRRMYDLFTNKEKCDGIDINTLKKLADYFGVTTDFLTGYTPSPDTHPDLPPLTPRDERDIAKDLEKMLAELDTSAAFGGNLTPDGEDLELLKSSLTQAMTLAKRVAKQKFTPKKYRKE